MRGSRRRSRPATAAGRRASGRPASRSCSCRSTRRPAAATPPARRTTAARSLEKWGDQDWHTATGGADARGKGGTSRYLPDVAWKLLTRAEREQTDTKKKGADEQFVANTEAAKEARAAAELLTMSAADAVKAVRLMEGASLLKRAKKAEEQHGKGPQDGAAGDRAPTGLTRARRDGRAT